MNITRIKSIYYILVGLWFGIMSTYMSTLLSIRMYGFFNAVIWSTTSYVLHKLSVRSTRPPYQNDAYIVKYH